MMTKAQKTTVTVLIAGAFLSILNQTLMNPALPSVMKDLQISATTAQWLVSGFTLINAIVVAVSAFLMDKFKTKHLFIGAFTLFFAGSLLAAWGVTFPVLLAGRFLQAVCAGVMLPLSMTALLIIFPMEKRGSAMGIYSFVVMFAPSIGPTVSGVLTDKVGWHVIFAVMAVLAAIIIAFAAFGMRNLSEPKKVRLDKLSLLLCSIGLFSLLYGFSQLGRAETLWLGAGTLLLGGILLVVFSKRQLALKKPFLQIGVMREKQFRAGSVILMLLSASLTAATITLPIYVQSIRGMSATVSGMIMMPGAILGAIAGYFSGKLSDKIGVRPLAIGGIILVIIGSAGMAFWGLNTPLAVLIAIYCVRYIGLMFVNTPVNVWAVGELTHETLGHGNAVSNTLRQVATSLGTTVMVSVMSFTASLYALPDSTEAQLSGIHVAFYLGTAIAIGGFILILAKVRISAPKAEDSKTAETELEAVMNTIKPANRKSIEK